MAVYTEVSDDELAAFLAGYDLGAAAVAARASPKASRIRIILLHTDTGYFILTLYEKRVVEADLPFFLGLMEHLSARGLTCPQPVKNRKGEALGRLAGRPAAMVTFLDGMWPRRPTAAPLRRGRRGARRTAQRRRRFSAAPPNALSIDALASAVRIRRRARRQRAPGLAARSQSELDWLEARLAARTCRRASSTPICFPTTCSSSATSCPALIDFYFACNDFFAYDLAICLNAWCFEPDSSFNITKGRALIDGYRARARARTRPKIDALPVLARGAAMRFLLTRLVDWLNVPPGALVRPKDPLEYFKQAALPPAGAAPAITALICDEEQQPNASRSGPTAPVPAIPAPAAGARS